MAATPALPLAGGAGAPSVNQRFDASRAIPTVLQPEFGIVANGVVPGVGPTKNAFYNSQLQYYNELAVAFPDLYLNMPVNLYPVGMPFLANYNNNSGVQG